MMMNSLSNGIVVLWLFLYFVSIFHKKLGGPDTEEVQMQNDTEWGQSAHFYSVQGET